MTFSAGTRIGRYEIRAQLGVGGMGEVYLAQDTKLDRKVALKILPPEVAANQDRMRRFTQEAKAAAALNHPHIAHIYEIGEADGTHFIAMEYVEGQSLEAEINGRALDTAEIVTISTQIADALDEAHSRGITHRDLKPSNIVITPRGQVKVIDFGLAKMAYVFDQPAASDITTRLKTSPGVVLGTAPYMSPEQVLGREIDHRTDIFSFGVLLYQMATGRLPFTGPTTTELVEQIIHAQPEAIARFNYDAPVELERITRKCLEKDRERRYQSAREIVIDLHNLRRESEAISAGRSESARTTSPPAGVKDRSAPWPVLLRSRPALVAITSVIVIAAAVVLALRFRGPSTLAPPEIKSLAVLPLDNLSGDPTQDYFADGMTEELTTSLAKIGALRVISRTSVMQYKGTRKLLPEIARELNVDAIVEGSVQRAGNRVKITAQLIHAPTDRHLWAETYERDLKDVLSLQSEVAGNIAREIQVKLTPQEQAHLTSARAVNPEAYDYYLRGKFRASRINRADNQAAIELLERAVTIDPNFATGHAELARAYTTKLDHFAPQEQQWEEKAFASVEKALSLDPDLAEAHLARGVLLWTHAYHFPHERAVQEYRRALSLNPNLDEAHHQLCSVYLHVGLFDKALQEIRTAVAINPSNNVAQYRVGVTYLYQGKDKDALEVFYKFPEAGNPSLWAYQTAWALFNLGRKDEASKTVEEFLRKYPEDTGAVYSFGAMLAAAAGDEHKAEEMIRSGQEKGKGFIHFHHTAYNIACAYVLLNKPEQALKWLQMAADDGLPCYPLFERDHDLDNLRQDPRFINFMAKQKEQWEYYKATL
jgi:serine/threonine protein kinase/Flp pilus assembly protein TadD